MISIAELFDSAGLSPSGPVPWKEPVPERKAGVYVIVEEPNVIIYIGRASGSIATRVGQFYRHKYGAKAPHRGGQEILRLTQPKAVYWAQADDVIDAEHKMIAAFYAKEGRLPHGNKNKGSRQGSAS